ncbi:hypothetical protein FOL46_005633 [Perkinsus olseni]|uniref:Uncharacterized protein n=1 Tax=Perkinsus olseni TaxID=32597 RepID=A0A7J6LQY8_PEROL|nr:hypothetical protein FOL46_005633 [Perkinsus olseni]
MEDPLPLSHEIISQGLARLERTKCRHVTQRRSRDGPLAVAVFCALPSSVWLSLPTITWDPTRLGRDGYNVSKCILSREKPIMRILSFSETDGTVDGTGYAFIRLDCSDKGITDLAEEVDTLKHLRQINLRSNLLTDVSRLSTLPHLLSLDLSNNKITTMDSLFQPGCLPWSQYIDLSHNSITSICPLAAMTRLRSLKLNANSIEDITRVSPDGHTALEELDLSDNSLTTLNGINNLPKLKFLRVASNQLTHVGEDALQGLDQLQLLDLHGGNTLLTLTGKPIEKPAEDGEEDGGEQQEEIPPPSPRSLPKFPPLPSLKTLNLSSTQFGAESPADILAAVLTTSSGDRALPELREIDITDTPALAAMGDDVKAELLLVLPKTLRTVNGEALTLEDLKASEDLQQARIAEREEKEWLAAELVSLLFDMSVSEGEREVQQQQQHLKVDYSKPYAKRRPDEPRSHYAQRLKFINELIRGMGDSLSDDRIDVLSNCYTNVKFLNNKYHPEIMEILENDGVISPEGNRTQAPLALLTDIYHQRNRGLRRSSPQTSRRRSSPVYQQPLRRIDSAPAWGLLTTSYVTTPCSTRHDHLRRYNPTRRTPRPIEYGSIHVMSARSATMRREGTRARRTTYMAAPQPLRPSAQRHTARPHHSPGKPLPTLMEPEWSSRSTGSSSGGVVSAWSDLGDRDAVPIEGQIRPVITYTHHCACGGYVFRKEL